MVGRFAVGGEMIVPRAVGAALSLLELVLGQGVICGVFTIPRNPAACSSSQPGVGPGYYVGHIGRDVAPVVSVSPCQFSSLVIFLHQSQKSFSRIGPDEPLTYRFGSADVGELVDAELGPPLLCVGFQGLDLAEAKSQLALVGFKVSKADDVRLYPVVTQVFNCPLHRAPYHPFFRQQCEVSVIAVVGRCRPRCWSCF
jgi:hypothetical protein